MTHELQTQRLSPLWVLLFALASFILLCVTTTSHRFSARDVLLPPRQIVTPLPALTDASSSSTPPPLTQTELSALVGEAPRFLAKDSQVTYGCAPGFVAGFGRVSSTRADSMQRLACRYNNLRYMFEATLNLATLTGRIPILPEAIWARGCAVERCIMSSCPTQR